MADYDQIMRALRNADAAGDTAAATRLAQMAKAARQTQAAPVAVQPAAQQPAEPNLPPEGMFLNPQTGQMTNRELLQANADPSRAGAAGMGYLQGFSANTADEMAGGVGYVMGGPDQAKFMREKARAYDAERKEDRPGMSLLGDLIGAVVSPLTKVFGPAKTVGGAAVQGGTMGAAYTAGAGEGGLLERAEDAGKGAVAGAVFGGVTKKTVDFGSAAFRRLYQKTAERPTVEGLRAMKSAAYQAVDASGAKFSQAEMKSVLGKAVADIRANGTYTAETDTQTRAALAVLENAMKRKDGMTISQLDKIRQNLYARLGAARNEVSIGVAIDAVDDLIASKAATNDLMLAARVANQKYKKAELLDRAMTKVIDQTAGTGSGGNILNKYRQAVESIINNEKKAKYFSAEEIDAMRGFVRGTLPENVLRRIGKLSPSGNGLMMALNLGAAALDPSMLAATAVAAGSKEAADRMAQRGFDGLIDTVTGYAAPSTPAMSGAVAPVAGMVAGQVVQP